MAGMFVVSEEICWISAGWIFMNVVESLAAAVDESDPANPSLASRLHHELQRVGSGYLDLRMVSSGDLAQLLNATDAMIGDLKRKGDQAFGWPEAFPLYIRECISLRHKLSEGLRERSKPH